MIDRLKSVARHATALALVGGAIATLAPGPRAAAQALTPPPAREGRLPPGPPPPELLARHLQGQLDTLSGRLEIKASQQAAWQAFRTAFQDTMTPHEAPPTPADEADAAALARAIADRASAHAQKLAQLAEATARLQQALGPDQRAVLNEVARQFVHEHRPMEPMGPMGTMGARGPWHAHGPMGGAAHDAERHRGDWGGDMPGGGPGHADGPPGEDGPHDDAPHG